MEEILESINFGDALIITAPPGWGKTYKILKAIKKSKRKVVFIFPLRALCDEVYLSALRFNILAINMRNRKDFEQLNDIDYSLIVTTPELLSFCENIENHIFILDEFHLFYYWGDTFRERMYEVYMEVISESVPILFLTATLGDELKSRLILELELNYESIHQINIGNQKLKNIPERIFYYPICFRSWMREDFLYSKQRGTAIIFCKYRKEVKALELELKGMGKRVISCVGGEAQEFVEVLSKALSPYDFIIATSVVSHGVNLPNIKTIYFNYEVENLDFYLQMLGRGGRDGDCFDVHVQNANYFSPLDIILGMGRCLLKRFSNRVQSILYYAYAS